MGISNCWTGIWNGMVEWEMGTVVQGCASYYHNKAPDDELATVPCLGIEE